jgi:saccharopine dehydrogenase-like NADP-dependent oxidoreductase
MKVLVLGGYGAVGARIVSELRERGVTALSAGRDPARAEVVLGSFDSLPEVDVVVNAAGVEDVALAEAVTRQGAAFVDITATSSYIAALERVTFPRPVLLSVGLAPGLTNLLAAEVNEVSPGQQIDIAIVLGAGEKHGAAATAWSYGLLGQTFRDPATGQRIRNYTRPDRFDLPGFGRRRLYRTDFSDQHTLTRDLGVPVRTYFGVDSKSATMAFAALTYVPGSSKMPQAHVPGSDAWLVLARSADGTARWLTGNIQSQATAVTAAIAARVVTTLDPGIHHLHTVLTLADLTPFEVHAA